MTQHTIPEVGEIPTEVRLKILYESEKAAIDQKYYHTYPEKLAYQLGYERAKCIDYLSTPPSSASSQPEKIVPNGQYFVAQCEKCGFKGSSEAWRGGGQIADTGDYGDSYYPACGQLGCEEADDDIRVDQTEMLLERIYQLNTTLDERYWELYEVKKKPSAESASSQGSMREAAERKAHAIAFGIWLVASEDVMFLSAAQLYEKFIDEENIKDKEHEL